MAKITLNREEIKKIIPHRDPMLLIDEVVDMEPEKNIVAKFYVDPSREIFKGHFPKEPVLPGVYTVEIMAQASDILILSCERYANKVPLFIGIDKVKFLSKIKPEDTLEVHSQISFEKEEKAIVTCSVEVYNNGTLACTGDVTLAMR
ncbi:MAG: 3-hydroxyacyl-ACP dehydratase FabZ [Anaerovoracaceae bacterium]